jgi:hypothetical protein
MVSIPNRFRLPSHALNVRGRTVHPFVCAVLDPKTELRCNDETLSRRLTQETTKKFFVLIRTVNFRCIQKIGAKFNVAAQDSQRLDFVCRTVGIDMPIQPKPSDETSSEPSLRTFIINLPQSYTNTERLKKKS